MSNQFNILDYTSGPLLKTGQTVDRTPAGRTTKDDGGFQRGIAGSKADAQYQVLTTGQYSGTTAITVNSIVDNHSNECVFDKVTGLLWIRSETPSIYGTGAQDLLWNDTAGVNEDIFKYCDIANLTQLSGFSDWRIPNIVELCSIAILNSPNARPDNTAFPSLSPTLFYSSTTRVDAVLRAYTLTLLSGTVSSSFKTTDRSKLLLCRLGIL